MNLNFDEIQKTIVVFITSILYTGIIEREGGGREGKQMKINLDDELLISLKLCNYFMRFNNSKFKKVHDDLLILSKELKELPKIEQISKIFEVYGFKPVSITNMYWQAGLAPYIWNFIHIICPIIDFEGSNIHKIKILHLIERVILCSICKRHYISNLQNLIKSLKENSLTNVMLAFHTSVTNRVLKEQGGLEQEEEPFKFHGDLINREYKKMYMNTVFKYAKI